MNKTYDIKKKLGERIKFLRHNKKFTQESFAEKINIEPQSLSNIERGKFAPSIETVQKIASVLEIQPYELYLFEQEETVDSMRKELINAIKTSDVITFELYNFFQNSKKHRLSVKK